MPANIATSPTTDLPSSTSSTTKSDSNDDGVAAAAAAATGDNTLVFSPSRVLVDDVLAPWPISPETSMRASFISSIDSDAEDDDDHGSASALQYFISNSLGGGGEFQKKSVIDANIVVS